DAFNFVGLNGFHHLRDRCWTTALALRGGLECGTVTLIHPALRTSRIWLLQIVELRATFEADILGSEILRGHVGSPFCQPKLGARLHSGRRGSSQWIG